jgi:hypothetical protein
MIMRRLLLAMTIVGMTWTVPQNAEAGLLSYIGRATVKLVYGVGDIIYSPLELIISPVTHGIDFDRHDVPAAIGAGIGLQVGATKTYIRAYRGVTDIATFLLVSERPRPWEWTVGGHQLPLTITLYDDDSGYAGEDAIPNR